MQPHNQESTIQKITTAGDLRGRTVVVRASLDVPMVHDEVLDQFRLLRAVPTVQYLCDRGAKVVLLAHVGRKPEMSLKPVYDVLQSHLDIVWAGGLLEDEAVSWVERIEPGQVLMLENLRSHRGEIQNDAALARALARLGDVYVNDAFAVAHREHASIVGIPQHLPAYAGMSFLHELAELDRAKSPEKPSLFILGGAKFNTKQPLVELFVKKYTHIFIGGALAHDFFAAKGYEIGQSLHADENSLEHSPLLDNEKVLLPIDVRAVDELGEVRITVPEDVRKNESILDIGPQSVEMLRFYTEEAATILWNGPMGNYEHGYADATEALAKLVAVSPAYTVVGGGDTVASIQSLGLIERFNFVSTAGGAMLEYLEKGTLPAIEALAGNYDPTRRLTVRQSKVTGTKKATKAKKKTKKKTVKKVTKKKPKKIVKKNVKKKVVNKTTKKVSKKNSKKTGKK